MLCGGRLLTPGWQALDARVAAAGAMAVLAVNAVAREHSRRSSFGYCGQVWGASSGVEVGAAVVWGRGGAGQQNCVQWPTPGQPGG